MKRKKAYFENLIMMILLLLCSTIATAWSADVSNQSDSVSQTTIMRPDIDTLKRWQADYQAAPEVSLDKNIDHQLRELELQGKGSSVSLLKYLKHKPRNRNQGACGNCWVWAGTGIMEIAL